MPDIFEVLPKIIKSKNPDLKITPNSTHSNNIIIEIKEDGLEAKLEKVVLTNFIEKKVFAFKMDDKNIKSICNIFDDSVEFFNKACDAIIFAEIKNKKYIFICELKSDRPKFNEYEKQFKSSNAFLDYLSSLLEHFYDIDLKEFKRKNILFMSGSSTRQTTGIKYKEKIYILKETKCNTPDETRDIREFI